MNIAIKAMNEQQKDKLWDMWLTLYPWMNIAPSGYKNPVKFMPFSKFSDKHITPSTPEKPLSAEEIIEKYEKKRHKHRKALKRGD